MDIYVAIELVKPEGQTLGHLAVTREFEQKFAAEAYATLQGMEETGPNKGFPKVTVMTREMAVKLGYLRRE